MPEPKDAVLPILRNIQPNLKRLESKVDNHGETLVDVSDRAEAMQGLMHCHLGMTTAPQHNILELQKQTKELRQRVSALEDARS